MRVVMQEAELSEMNRFCTEGVEKLGGASFISPYRFCVKAELRNVWRNYSSLKA